MRIPISNTKQSSHNIAMMFVLSFFFPILGAIFSFFTYRDKNAKNIFWLFCSFLGLIHIFHPEGTVLGEGIDGGRYALELIYMHNNIDSLTQFLGTLYNESELDIYQPILTYFVSRFTDNPHWLFFVFAIVFGYFYSRNIWYLFDKLPSKFPKILWILIAYYILICPIWNINGVRMWTALHIFVYGAMPYILEKKTKGIGWCFLSVFVHFSFIVPLLILIVYRLFYIKHVILLFVFYIVSLFVKTINWNFLRDLLSNISFLQTKTSYLSEEYIEVIESRQYAWHVLLAEDVSYWVIQILIFISFYLYCKDRINWSECLKNLYSFSLFIYSISNVMSSIPSGSRFLIVSKMFMLPFIILLLANNLYGKKKSILLFYIPLIFSIIFQIRTGLDYYGIMLFIGNFITASFIVSDVPLINYIK